MNASRNTNTATVKVNETFLRLLNGATTIGDIMTERAAARAARITTENAIVRCRREWNEAREEFFAALAY